MASAPKIDPASLMFNPESRSWFMPISGGLLLVVAALVMSLAAGADGMKQFYFSYLVAYVFVLSIALGSMMFVMFQHITKAHWSVVIRRLPESILRIFPFMAILAIPIVLGMHDLFHWTHHDLVVPGPDFDPVIAGKSGYLNSTFFIGRLVLYFAIWSFIGYRLHSLSTKQDETGDTNITLQLRKMSAWGIPVVGFSIAFCGFDLLMSLDPHWFSTMFGVYFFAGGFVTSMAVIIITGKYLQSNNRMDGLVTVEHYHDLGKYIFAFSAFWAYIAFSQYMLIWYAGLPEETVWFRHRFEGGYEMLATLLIFGHFFAPFVVLMMRRAKRNGKVVLFMAVWLVAFQYIDLYWVVMPVLNHHLHFGLVDALTGVGFLLLLVGLAIRMLGGFSLVPHKDPLIDRSTTFQNM